MRRLAWQAGNDKLPRTADPTDSYITQRHTQFPAIELQIVVEPSTGRLRRVDVGDLDVDFGVQFR